MPYSLFGAVPCNAINFLSALDQLNHANAKADKKINSKKVKVSLRIPENCFYDAQAFLFHKRKKSRKKKYV
jgi:hypothetical protein